LACRQKSSKFKIENSKGGQCGFLSKLPATPPVAEALEAKIANPPGALFSWEAWRVLLMQKYKNQFILC